MCFVYAYQVLFPNEDLRRNELASCFLHGMYPGNLAFDLFPIGFGAKFFHAILTKWYSIS